ncbi:MAG: hypothetical protein OEM02_06710 [Desulfobulbaceae bacterium]|nr:hypothetical protein [Desulfobulbaceae bacterium]
MTLNNNLQRLLLFLFITGCLSYIGFSHQGSPAQLQVRCDFALPTIFQVFWTDSGESFSEKRSYNISLAQGDHSFAISLPPVHTIKKLRIDLANHSGPLTVYALNIQQNSSTIWQTTGSTLTEKSRTTNLTGKSITQENGKVFVATNNDPYIVIPLDNQGHNFFIIKRLLQALISSAALTIILSALTSESYIKYIEKRYPKVKRHLLPWAAISFVSAMFLCMVLPLAPHGNQLLYFLFCSVTVAILLFLVSFAVATRPYSKKTVASPQRLSWLAYAIPSYIIWTIYLSAFLPAAMSPDSLEQWRDVNGGIFHIKDWHPAFHTMLMWVVTRVWFSPTMVAICQILSLGAVAGWSLAIFQRYGTPKPVTWFMSILFALWPVNGFMTVTLWKDIPYGTALLAFSALLLHIVMSDGAWLQKTRNWLLLGFVIFCVAIFRHNGILPAFATTCLLPFLYRDVTKKLLAALALSILLFIGVRGPLYQALEVQRGNPLSVVYNKLSTLVSGTETTAKSSQANKPAHLPKKKNKISISDEISQRLAASSLLWRIQPLNGFFRREEQLNFWRKKSGDQYTLTYISSNKMGLTKQPLSARLNEKFYDLYSNTKRGPLFFIWRASCYLYFFLFCLAIGCYRQKNIKLALIALPVLLSSLPVLLIIIHKSILRYHYGLLIVSLLFSIPLLYLDKRKTTEHRESEPNRDKVEPINSQENH